MASPTGPRARRTARPSAAALRLLILALDYEEPGLVALVKATLEDMAACARMFGRRHTHWPASAGARSAALLEAAKAGSPRICKILIHAGADANYVKPRDHRTHRGEWGRSPLYHAAREGHAATVAVLLAAPGVDPGQAKNTGWAPLHTAARKGHVSVVALLLAHPGVDPNQAKTTSRHRGKSGATPLFVAALNGHADVVALLLANPGVDPNRASNSRATPLFVAANNGRTGVVTLLLAAPGVDPNKANRAGATPLRAAARNGHADVAGLLRATPGVDTRW